MASAPTSAIRQVHAVRSLRLRFRHVGELLAHAIFGIGACPSSASSHSSVTGTSAAAPRSRAVGFQTVASEHRIVG